MMNLQKLEMVLSDLIHGVPYYVRVAAGNAKGYSPYSNATPSSAAPSSKLTLFYIPIHLCPQRNRQGAVTISSS